MNKVSKTWNQPHLAGLVGVILKIKNDLADAGFSWFFFYIFRLERWTWTGMESRLEQWLESRLE